MLRESCKFNNLLFLLANCEFLDIYLIDHADRSQETTGAEAYYFKSSDKEPCILIIQPKIVYLDVSPLLPHPSIVF